MDDDSRTITMQIKGEAYRFAPLDPEDLGRYKLLGLMDVSDGVQTKALFTLLRKSLGDDVWDGLAMRFVTEQVPLKTELPRIFKKLVNAAVKDVQTSADGE